jgi:hypothetical protein
MKVLMVTSFTYQKDGQTKTGYNVGLQKADGTKITATAYEPIKDGDEIAEDRLHPGKREGEWVIWSEKKGKGNYQKNDDSIRAQCAFKGMVDLIIANKMNVADLNTPTCIKLATIIKNTEDAVKSGAPVAAPPASPPAPAGHPPTVSAPDPSKVPPPPAGCDGPIKSMGELRTRIKKTYSTLQTVAAQDSILGDTKLITDYDAAFKKVVDYMEKPL